MSYRVKHGKAADLLLSVIINLYNIHPDRYLLPVILLLSEITHCLPAILRMLCKIYFSAI